MFISDCSVYGVSKILPFTWIWWSGSRFYSTRIFNQRTGRQVLTFYFVHFVILTCIFTAFTWPRSRESHLQWFQDLWIVMFLVMHVSYLPICHWNQKQKKQLSIILILFKQLRILTYFFTEEVQSSQATCMTLVVVGWEGLGRPTQFIKTTCTDLQLCLK